MIAPEYFNNHIAVEGEIVVKRVPNDTGSVVVWNSATKKLSIRTHAEIVADLNLATVNTNQLITGIKSFVTSGGNYAPFNNTLQIYADDGSLPSMTYSKGGSHVGQIMFNSDGFYFKNGDNNAFYNVKAGGFEKSNSDNNHVLLGGGGHKAVSDFALSSDLSNVVTTNTAQTIIADKVFKKITTTDWVIPRYLAFPDASGTLPNYIGFYMWNSQWQVNWRDASNTYAYPLLDIDGVSKNANFYGNTTAPKFTTPGGNSDQWNEAYNALDNSVTLNTDQGVTGKKIFYNQGQNFSELPLVVWGNNGSKGGIGFVKGGTDSAILNFDTEFHFTSNNNDSYKFINAAGVKVAGSDDNHVVLGGGGNKSLSELMTTNTEQDVKGKKRFFTKGNTSFYTDNALMAFSNDGSWPAMTFYRNVDSAGQIIFYGNYFGTMNESGNQFINLKTGGFVKDGSDNNYILLGGGGHIPISNFAGNGFKDYQDNRIIYPDEIATQKLQFGFTGWNNNGDYPYADFLHFGGYQDGSGGNQNLLMLKRNGFGIRQYQAPWQDHNPYAYFVDYWNTENFTQNDVEGWKNLVTSYSKAVRHTGQQTSNLVNYIPTENFTANVGFTPYNYQQKLSSDPNSANTHPDMYQGMMISGNDPINVHNFGMFIDQQSQFFVSGGLYDQFAWKKVWTEQHFSQTDIQNWKNVASGSYVTIDAPQTIIADKTFASTAKFNILGNEYNRNNTYSFNNTSGLDNIASGWIHTFYDSHWKYGIVRGGDGSSTDVKLGFDFSSDGGSTYNRKLSIDGNTGEVRTVGTIYSNGDIKADGQFYGKAFYSPVLNGGQVFNAANGDTLYVGNPQVAAFYLESDNNNLFHNRAGYGVGVIWDAHNFNPDLKHAIDLAGWINNGSSARTNKSWFDYNWAESGQEGSVINFSGLNGNYSTELFGSYNNPNKIGIRTKNGDNNTWNSEKWLWHSDNFNPAQYATQTWVNSLLTNSRKKTYFFDVTAGLAVYRLYLPQDTGTYGLTVKIRSDYANYDSTGLTEFKINYGKSGSWIFHQDFYCSVLIGNVRGTIYLQPQILYDSTLDKPYINVHKFVPLSNPINLEVEVVTKNYNANLNDTSLTFVEDAGATVLDLRNKNENFLTSGANYKLNWDGISDNLSRDDVLIGYLLTSQNISNFGFVTYPNLNTQLGNYATLNRVQTFTNTNTFTQSPVIPDATLGTHAVNLNQLNVKANASGSNATDMWNNSSLGLQANPTILGKMFNSSGQSDLRNATYGSVIGYINEYGIASGNPGENWFYRMKFLHGNNSGYYGEIAVQMTSGNGLFYKRYEDGTDFGWIQTWDQQNLPQTSIDTFNAAYSWGDHADAGYYKINNGGPAKDSELIPNGNQVISIGNSGNNFDGELSNKALEGTFANFNGDNNSNKTLGFTLFASTSIDQGVYYKTWYGGSTPWRRLIDSVDIQNYATQAQVNGKVNSLENAHAVGFSSGSSTLPPYIYHSSDGYVFLATQNWSNDNLVTLHTDQNNITGKKRFEVGYTNYTMDGLFSSDARPLSIRTPGGNDLLFGYKDYASGQYYPRIGFNNSDPLIAKWSLGTLGNVFVLGTDNDDAQTFKFHKSGATSKTQNSTNIFHKVYQGYYDAGGHTGILAIKMPQASPNQAMFSIDINVYGYESQYLGKVNVAFYKYVSETIISNGSKALFDITDNFPTTVARVGIGSDGHVSILLGQPDTFWNGYFSFEVAKVEVKYTNYTLDWSQGWTHALETSISQYGSNLITLPTDVGATRSWVDSNFVTNTALNNFVTTNTPQDINAQKTFRNSLRVVGANVNSNTTKLIIGNEAASNWWALSAGDNNWTEDNFYVGTWDPNTSAWSSKISISNSGVIGTTNNNGTSENWKQAYDHMLPNQNWGSAPGITNRMTIGEMAWKRYGNGHTIFDISSGTTPWNDSKSSVDAEIPWQNSFPTLVGGNGANTYGVRVDSARNADNLGNISAGSYVTQSNLNNQLLGYATLNGVQTFTNTNTFTSSPVIPNGTLGAHAVNKNQIQLNTGTEGENGQQLTISGNNSVNLTNFFVTSRDGSRNPDDIAPNSTPKRVRFDFAYATTAGLGGSGNYAGIMTYSPWDGTSASTGDSSYQLAFANQTGIDGSGIPMLKIRKGINGNWTSLWYKFWTEADFSLTNIQQWNHISQFGLQLNQTFSATTGYNLMISDDYFGNESGLVDAGSESFVAGRVKEYYKYGSRIKDGLEGINYHLEKRTIGIGGEADKNKVSVKGCVKATENFKSKDERADTIFIPDGNVASLKDEIINDESEYAIRLDPHHYEIDPSGYLEVDDRNRLIHVIGEQIKMAVDFKEIYPKQQIVIYNFDQKNYPLAVLIKGKVVYNIEPGLFLRLYVTESLRVIAERPQPCEFVW